MISATDVFTLNFNNSSTTEELKERSLKSLYHTVHSAACLLTAKKWSSGFLQTLGSQNRRTAELLASAAPLSRVFYPHFAKPYELHPIRKAWRHLHPLHGELCQPLLGQWRGTELQNPAYEYPLAEVSFSNPIGQADSFQQHTVGNNYQKTLLIFSKLSSFYLFTNEITSMKTCKIITTVVRLNRIFQ